MVQIQALFLVGCSALGILRKRGLLYVIKINKLNSACYTWRSRAIAGNRVSNYSSEDKAGIERLRKIVDMHLIIVRKNEAGQCSTKRLVYKMFMFRQLSARL